MCILKVWGSVRHPESSLRSDDLFFSQLKITQCVVPELSIDKQFQNFKIKKWPSIWLETPRWGPFPKSRRPLVKAPNLRPHSSLEISSPPASCQRKRKAWGTVIFRATNLIECYSFFSVSLSASQLVVFFSHTRSASAISQQYFSFTINQHQPSATTSRTERVEDESTSPGLDNVADQDSVSEVVVHQHADQVAFAESLHGVQSIVAVLRKDHALRLRLEEPDKGMVHRCARRRGRRLQRQKAQGDLAGHIDRRQRLLIAAAVTGSASLRVTESEI